MLGDIPPSTPEFVFDLSESVLPQPFHVNRPRNQPPIVVVCLFGTPPDAQRARPTREAGHVDAPLQERQWHTRAAGLTRSRLCLKKGTASRANETPPPERPPLQFQGALLGSEALAKQPVAFGKRPFAFAAIHATLMITFASFAAPPDDLYGHGHRVAHPIDPADDRDMDIDFDDEEFVSGSKLTVPGETLTSSHAFMRYALPARGPVLHTISLLLQRTRHVCRQRAGHRLCGGHCRTRE